MVLGAGILAAWHLAQGQTAVDSIQPVAAAPEILIPALNPNRPLPPVASVFANINITLESVGDLQTMLEAVQTAPSVPLASLPRNQAYGTFWSLQNPYWPPLPGIMHGENVWLIGNGRFIIDDRLTDYAALQAKAELAAAVASKNSASMMMMSSSLANNYAYGNAPYLKNLAATIAADGSMNAGFDIAGGTNNVPYDILMTTNLSTPSDSWNWLGIGYTSNRYSFSGQPAGMALYALAKPSKTMTVAWGGNTYGQCDIWSGITNAVAVSGGYEFSLALLNNGTVTGWGYNGASSGDLVPTDLAGVAMISSGWIHNVALLTNGTVTVWGDNYWGELNMPAGLSNACVVSAQGLHSLVLLTNGTVVAWGYDSGYGDASVPAGLTNVTAISAGGWHNLAVSNGYVVAWGYNSSGQCTVPAGLSNVADVAAGGLHSVALKTDGTVVCWGDNTDGECNVPGGLTNVVAIAAGGYISPASGFTIALKKDGTPVIWGNSKISAPLGGLNNVIAISGGTFHALAVRTGPRTPVITLAPMDQYQAVGGTVTFSGKGAGLYGVTYQWQTNGVNLPGATNATLTLTNVQMAQEGIYNVVVTGNGGTGSIVSPNASLALVTPPVITSQAPMPTNQVATFQTNLTLSVTATAPGQFNGFPLHYQWQFNGTNISGANSNSYTFFVDSPSLGNYSVIVSNLAGSVTSLVWQVSMTYAGSYIDVGTLAYHLSTNAVARTNGISNIYEAQKELSGWNYSYFTETNMASLTNSVWSTNFWLKGVHGLSATSIGFSNGLAAQGSVTMISPRHCIYAKHMHEAPGRFMAAFLDTNNVIYWRTNMENIFITNDISVGILDSDLPASVGYLPMLPANFATYLPTNSSGLVQGIGRNQAVSMFAEPIALTSPVVSWNVNNTAPFGVSTNWNVNIVGGDSSNPVMFLVKNQLVLVSHNWSKPSFTSPITSGPNHAAFFDLINQNMHYLSTNNSVGSDYQLTPFLLTNWPTINH